MTQENSIPTSRRYFLLAAIFGIVTTIIHYSGYGVGNHIQQLPIIIRSLDSGFLLNDFFTNITENSISRVHYANFIAMIAGSEHNLPLVFLILVLCTNISISIITFHLGRYLFNNSNVAGIYASALVMSVHTFGLSWRSQIYLDLLNTNTIAIPIIMGAIWAVIVRRNLIVGVTLSGIASIIHPLIGLETGGLLLITFVAFHIMNNRKIIKDEWKVIIPSLLVLIIFSLITIIPQFSQPRIDSDLYIYIIAYFRHPHHFVPSTLHLYDYVFALCFLVAAFLSYYNWRQKYKIASNFIAILGSAILLLCVCGYIFVEIIPSNIWVTAQLFRLLFIVKWLGLVLIGGTITELIAKKGRSTKALYLASVFSPLTLGLALLSQTYKNWLEKDFVKFSKLLDPSLILLINIAILLRLSVPLISIILFGSYILSILVVSTFHGKSLYSIILISITVITIGITFHSRIPRHLGKGRLSMIANNLTLKITNSELGSEGDLVAEFARRNTPEDAVFLTPLNWGQFRLLARRAIVVDFKSFPFADKAMLEWHKRITNCYGSPTAMGFFMIDELNENYRYINDSKLRALSEQYDFSYVVLYSETSTSFNVIFQNRKYKIVELCQEVPNARQEEEM